MAFGKKIFLGCLVYESTAFAVQLRKMTMERMKAMSVVST